MKLTLWNCIKIVLLGSAGYWTYLWLGHEDMIIGILQAGGIVVGVWFVIELILISMGVWILIKLKENSNG